MVGAGTTDVPAGTTGPQLAYWESECIDAPSLNPTSTLNWNTNQEGYITVQARTASSCENILSTTYKDIVASGDKINPSPGDTKIRVRVFFRREFPNFVDQEWKLWRGLNQTRYRRRHQDPQLFDLTINNSTMFYRNRFSLGMGVSTPQDASGPVTQSVNVAGDGSLQLSAGIGNQTIASKTNPVGEAYAGAFLNHTPLNIGATGAAEGTLVMKRPDGRYMILIGGSNGLSLGGTNPPSSANAEIYDPSNSSFTNAAAGVFNSTCSGTGGLTGCVPNDGASQIATGRGALVFKRPDGKFFIVAGSGGTTGGTTPNNGFTNIYDPVAGTFATGPPLAGMTGSTAPYAGRGSMAIPLPNGNVLIIHGNYGKHTSIYNPTQNTMINGPDTPVAVGMGAMALPRPDGAYLLIPGMSVEFTCTLQTATYIFDPFNINFQPSNTILSTGVGPGAHAFQRSDGYWVIIHGAGTATLCTGTGRYQIYNPNANRFSQVLSLTTGVGGTAGWGSSAMLRPDGSQLLTMGNGSTSVQIYMEKSGAALAEGIPSGTAVQIAPTILTTAVNTGTSPPGNGAVTFQRDDGKFIMIPGMLGTWGTPNILGGTGPSVGAASANVYQYDAGWVQSGLYRTEQMNIPDLTSASTLSWKTSRALNGRHFG